MFPGTARQLLPENFAWAKNKKSSASAELLFIVIILIFLFDQVNLNPTVLSPTGSGVVSGNRFRLAITYSLQPAGINTFFDQEVPYRVGTTLRQLLVQRFATYTVSMTFYGESGIWIFVKDSDDINEYRY
jgi:hypothetical protein